MTNLDKRAFLIGYFVAQVEQKDGVARASRVNVLCDVAGMTPLSEQEANELRLFLDFAADMMEKNAAEKGMLR